MLPAKHLVVRYSEKFGPTIDLHNQVVEEKGHVLFGKMGSSVGARWIKLFEIQIASEVDTYLYVVRREGMRYVLHRACLLAVRTKDEEKNVDLLPSYYRSNNLIQWMRCFFDVTRFEPCGAIELKRLRVASSGGYLSEALTASMVGAFVVERT